MKAAWIIPVAAAVLSFGQTATKKGATPPPAKKAPAEVPKPDIWQRSKECAAQAEKVMVEANRQNTAAGGGAAMHWENHYSPKYNRCFVSATYLTHARDGGGKDGPMFSTELIDAFERSVLANSAIGGPTSGFCEIEGKFVACEKAASFISEHMKD